MFEYFRWIAVVSPLIGSGYLMNLFRELPSFLIQVTVFVVLATELTGQELSSEKKAVEILKHAIQCPTEPQSDEYYKTVRTASYRGDDKEFKLKISKTSEVVTVQEGEIYSSSLIDDVQVNYVDLQEAAVNGDVVKLICTDNAKCISNHTVENPDAMECGDICEEGMRSETRRRLRFSNLKFCDNNSAETAATVLNLLIASAKQ
jgi:hypothetical protein